MIKLCIWMNIPSHYQAAFFRALDARGDVDLRVVYLSGSSSDRSAEGWCNTHDPMPYESFAEMGATPAAMMDAVDGWRERIHIVAGAFCPGLIGWLCGQDVRWCHWSEPPGIRLAELLGYRVFPFRLLHPLMLLCKRSEGRRIRRSALGAFGQGTLARRAFRLMGVPREKIADLYYAPDGLQPSNPCPEVVSFACGRKVFLFVGALCRRKGVDVLLKAFAQLDATDWCMVLCGLDRSNGEYESLAARLGIRDRVLFLGAFPVERIAEVYCAADVFVLPSRFDGWGAVLNEAASIGLPLIATDLCGAAWHIINHGHNGYRVRAGSKHALASAIGTYIGDAALVMRHRARAQGCFDRSFSPEKNAQRMMDTLTAWIAR